MNRSFIWNPSVSQTQILYILIEGMIRIKLGRALFFIVSSSRTVAPLFSTQKKVCVVIIFFVSIKLLLHFCFFIVFGTSCLSNHICLFFSVIYLLETTKFIFDGGLGVRKLLLVFNQALLGKWKKVIRQEIWDFVCYELSFMRNGWTNFAGFARCEIRDETQICFGVCDTSMELYKLETFISVEH